MSAQGGGGRGGLSSLGNAVKEREKRKSRSSFV